MRERIINLLRDLEKMSGFNNQYHDYFHDEQADYSVEEFLEFPNYRTISLEYNKKYGPIENVGIVFRVATNSISAELKRMEMDGLVIIGIQEGIKYATTTDSHARDYDDGIKINCESIVLTTKGKDAWKYFIHKVKENPVNLLISLLALVVSIIALYK